MQPFITVTGRAVPLLQSNIDTDVIIRIERLTGGADLGRYAFEAGRYLPDGSPKPDCALHDPRFAGARALPAGPDFCCGSPPARAAGAPVGGGPWWLR